MPIVKIGIVIGFIGLLFYSSDHIEATIASKLESLFGYNNKKVTYNPETELQYISNLIVGDNEWAHKRIDLFVYYWGLLDQPEQYQLKSKLWFQQFMTLLSNKMAIQSVSKDVEEIKNRDLIRTLALVIGKNALGNSFDRQAPRHFIQTNIEINNIAAKFEQPTENLNNFTSQKNFTTRKKLGPRAVLAKLKAQLIPTNYGNRRGKTPRNKLSAQTIEIDEIDQLVEQYAFAYRIGNTAGILELLSATNMVDKNGRTQDLKKTYQTIFDSSSKREVEFNDLFWEFQDGRATGTGKYKAITELENNKGTQTIEAKLSLDVKKVNNKLLIANLELINPIVKLIKPKIINIPIISLPTVKKPLAKKPSGKSKWTKRKKSRQKAMARLQPTLAELYRLINQYTDAYEEGNMKEILSLFSTNAKTDTQDSKAGLQKEFTGLFKNTSDRQIFIRNINWSIKDSIAKGIGDIQILTISNNSNNIATMNGKLHITATKKNNKLNITQLYKIDNDE